MKWFRASLAPSPSKPATGAPRVCVASAVAAARSARERSDWVEALLELEIVKKKDRDSVDFHILHAWALEQVGRLEEARTALRHALTMTPQDASLLSSQEALKKRIRAASPLKNIEDNRGQHKLRFGGAGFDLRPHDAAVLTQLLQDVRPESIFEMGTRGGGVAQWLAALTTGMGLNTKVHSADWGRHHQADTERLTFSGGDLRKPGSIWPGSLLKQTSHPALVLLRPGGGYEVAWSCLRAWHKWLTAHDVVCLLADEGGPGDTSQKRTAEDALARFTGRHPVEYEYLPKYAGWFGEDSAHVSLRCARRTALNPFDEVASPELGDIRQHMARNEWSEALTQLNAIKATRNPKRGTDYLRALCFLNLGESFSVCEAAKEELRYFPGHEHAAAVLASMMRQIFPGRPKIGSEEFAELYAVVRPYTMLSDERLYSIYLRTRLICQMDVPGDIVECGVAAGGASALMAATIARHSKRLRKVFSCDTFEGMPTPTERDVHSGTDAEASGWGSGTCAAPAGSLLEVAQKLGVADRVEPVKGLFADTLPELKNRLPDGIAFLHMDGDWYESTRDILVNLYEKVQPRGFVQVDDYGYWEGCRDAMHDYAREHGFELKVNVIDGTGVWFQRPDRRDADFMLLNLGCGAHYHKDWVNLDIQPAGPGVIAHDLAREPLPFDEGTCRMVYHSHVLEHIPPQQVPPFIAECRRVLAPGGVLRIAVPDLEGIVRAYLQQLEAGDHAKHEWMIIELVDQLARNHSGGRMMEHWKQNPMPAEDFVMERLGREAGLFVENWRANPVESPLPSSDPGQIGRFRLSGEVHQWMYDRVSLERLLTASGFCEVRVCAATESSIAGFASYQLDADSHGAVRKPDSLFVEARKPASS